jgi:hypothetical protein
MAVELLPLQAITTQGGGLDKLHLLKIQATLTAGETEVDIDVTNYGMDPDSVLAAIPVAEGNTPVMFSIMKDFGTAGNYHVYISAVVGTCTVFFFGSRAISS